MQGFVTCAYGAHVIGRVVIVFGICNATFSFASGYIIKVVGRPAIFVFGAVMNVIVIAVMLGWAPASDQVYVVYILAAMWGLGDAVWQTQVTQDDLPFILSCRSLISIYILTLKYLVIFYPFLFSAENNITNHNSYIYILTSYYLLLLFRSMLCTALCSRPKKRLPSPTTGCGSPWAS